MEYLKGISFSFPWAFLILIVSPLIVYISIKSLSHMSKLHLAISTAWRILVLTIFSAALANPFIKSHQQKICMAVLVDVSESIPSDSFGKTKSIVDSIEKSKPKGSPLFLMAFADRAIPISKMDLEKAPLIFEKKLDRSKTNILSSIHQAEALIPRDCTRRLVIFTDGNDTERNPSTIADNLSSSGIEIIPFPARGETEKSEIIVENIITPESVKINSPFTSTIEISSSKKNPATIRLFDIPEKHEPTLLEQREVELNEGKNSIKFTPSVSIEGKHILRAEVDAPQTAELFTTNNEFYAGFMANAPEEILYIEGEPSRGGYLRSALSKNGYSVKMLSPSFLSSGNLENFEAVFLSDIPYNELPSPSFGKIKAYVHGGGIFVFSGGKNSYGVGGYRGSPFESFLPVSMDVEKELQKPQSAVVMALDKSGSMSGTPIKMLREAAKASIATLDPDTLVGIISFDYSPTKLVKIQPAKNKFMIESLISKLTAGGGTNILSALQMAYDEIAPVKARKKHILLMTDGQSSHIGIEQILLKSAGHGITISTIGLGSNVDRGFLEKIAVSTGGKSYFTSNPENLPRFMIQDMRIVTPPAIVEGVIDVKVQKYLPFIGKIGGNFPYLRGYNLTSSKGGSAITCLVSEKNDPILAMWRQGKGWVVAFTSDVKSRWGAPWVGWNSFGKFWVELIRFLAGKEKKEKEEIGKIETTIDGKRVLVSIDLIDEAREEFVTGAYAEGTFFRFGDSSQKTFKLEETAPGHYTGDFLIDDYGSYFVNLEISTNSGFIKKGSTTLNIPYPLEYRKIGANNEILHLISEKTTQKKEWKIDKIWSKPRKDIEYKKSIRDLLILLLLLMIPIDIAIRRLPL